MDPDPAGFVGLGVLMTALVAWLRADMNGRMERLETAQAERFGRIEAVHVEQGERLTRIEATLSEHGAILSRHGAALSAHGATLSGRSELLARIETAQNELRKHMEGMETGLLAVRGELAHTNERMARIEGAVAGALGRPFPELMTRAPDVADIAAAE